MRLAFLSLALIPSILWAQDENPEQADLPELGGLLDGTSGEIAAPKTYHIKTGPQTQPSVEFGDGGEMIITFDGYIALRADNGLQIFGNRAVLNESVGTIRISGDVSVYQGGLVYRGESATYYIEEQRADTKQLRVGVDPILMEAGQFQAIPYKGGTAYVGENSGITTHDAENPDFWLRSSKTTIIPGDRIIFRDLKLVAGDRTLFWLPYLSQPFDQELGYHILPGGRSNLGLFVKNRYGLMLGGTEDPVTGIQEDSWLLAQMQADLYTLRGLGLGTDFFDTRIDSKNDFGWLKLYYIHDFNSDLERAGIDRGSVTDDRFRIDLAYRSTFWKSGVADYSYDANLTWLSDEFFLEDFDPRTVRIDSNPDNFLSLNRRTANSITSLGTRLRLNSFYQTDTRLPELTHDWIRQPLMNTNILYESQTSWGIYEESLSDFREDSLRREADLLSPDDPRHDEINQLLDGWGFNRFHTYHEASFPFSAGFLNITPRVGAGYTAYSDVQGINDSTSRTHISAGVDASFKMTRAYPDWMNPKLGVDGALHILEPYASLSWLSTDELDSSFGRIERLTPTTRPRTRRVGRFTARDDLADWQTLRLGARNRIVTNRNGGTHDWLFVDTYFDTFFEDPEFNRDFSNIYNDVIWRPLPWLELDLETQFPLFNDSNFTEIALGSRFMAFEDLEINFGYRQLTDHPILGDSNRVELETFFRMNEYWGFGTHHSYEFEDHTLEFQRYNLHYDFESWVGSVGLFHQDNRSNDEYGILFSFGLKEIPSLSLPFSFDSE